MEPAPLTLFRQRVDELGLGRPGKPYPVELRKLALNYAHFQLDAGIPKRRIAEQLGIRSSTLTRWLEPDDLLQGDFIAVTMMASKSHKHDIELHSPGGWRITGISLHQAADLLQALGC